jgi:hypothetical protein
MIETEIFYINLPVYMVSPSITLSLPNSQSYCTDLNIDIT